MCLNWRIPNTLLCWLPLSIISMAMEYLPPRPVRPVSWIVYAHNASTSSGGPKWMTCLTSWQSIPIPKATVAITTLRLEFFDKWSTTISLTTESLLLWYISKSLNCAISGASIGSVSPSWRKSLNKRYRSHSHWVWYNRSMCVESHSTKL